MRNRVLDLGACAGADVPADVDHVDLVGQVDLALVHVVEHFLDAGEVSGIRFFPDFAIAGVAEEPDADDDVSFQGQALLGVHEGVFEAGAAAEGGDGVGADHNSHLSSLTKVKLKKHKNCSNNSINTIFMFNVKT